MHRNEQALPAPQRQSPLAQVPLQEVPSQSTWHGGAAQRKPQRLSSPQEQLPLAQVPEQSSLSPSHTTVHGGAAQSKAHESPESHTQLPPWQSSSSQPAPSAEARPNRRAKRGMRIRARVNMPLERCTDARRGNRRNRERRIALRRRYSSARRVFVSFCGAPIQAVLAPQALAALTW